MNRQLAVADHADIYRQLRVWLGVREHGHDSSHWPAAPAADERHSVSTSNIYVYFHSIRHSISLGSRLQTLATILLFVLPCVPVHPSSQ